MTRITGVFSALDDPEGSFVPPEFDSTGSTFEVRTGDPLRRHESGHSSSVHHTKNSVMFTAETLHNYASKISQS